MDDSGQDDRFAPLARRVAAGASACGVPNLWIQHTVLFRFQQRTNDLHVDINPFGPAPVSYTHLDVYKRQLFDSAEGFRHTCFITNTEGTDIAALELRHRGHARVEDRIRNWKDCGLSNLPFDSFVRNEAWVATSLIAGALLAWSQMVCFDGALAKAEPKTMRYRVLHVAALLVHKSRGLILRLDKTWPWVCLLYTSRCV